MKKLVLKISGLSAFFVGIVVIMGTFSIYMPGEGRIEQLKPLSHEQFHAAQRLKHHVNILAGEIGERHYNIPEAYIAAANYIETAFGENGLVPYLEAFGDKSQYQNIIAEHYGATLPDEIIVIGAHYDTVAMTPGADDNASGVAVMLELARQIKTMQLDRSIRFIAFANEERPHYLTDNMGSLHHAKRANQRGDNITAMISLEMLGYYSNEPGSQNYPDPFHYLEYYFHKYSGRNYSGPFHYLYPDTANFVAFIGNFASRKLLRQSIKTFRETAEFSSEGIAAPVALVPDVRRSDHAAFWRYKIPAFMVTDTMAYRNHAYHNVGDVPNSLNYDNMARVTSGLIYMIKLLASVE